MSSDRSGNRVGYVDAAAKARLARSTLVRIPLADAQGVESAETTPRRRTRRHAWAVLCLAAATSCGENGPPATVGTIPDQQVHINENVVVTGIDGYFEDPDLDALEYGATSSAAGAVSASLAGTTLTLAASAKGESKITVTATDPDGESAKQEFTATVPNRAPVKVGTILDQQVYVNEVVVIDVDGYFDDLDGDVLVYGATSAAADVVSASLAGTTLTLAASAKGESKITVTAKDPDGGSAGQEFTVTVPNRAPVAVGTIAPQSVAVGESKTLDLAGYFDDPDGDDLGYGAESVGAVKVSLEGSALAIEGVGVGMATVTAFAADPEGEEASQSFRVTVTDGEGAPVFRDDFDDGLEAWDTTGLDGATAEIVNGNLHIVIDDCRQNPTIFTDLGKLAEGDLRFSAPLWEIPKGDEYIVVEMAMGNEEMAYFLALDFEEWAYRAYYEDEDGEEHEIVGWGYDDDGELVDWHGETEIEFGLRGTTFYAVGTDTIFTKDMRGKMPGDTDPERIARYVGFTLTSSCFGEHGLGIDWVEFDVGK